MACVRGSIHQHHQHTVRADRGYQAPLKSDSGFDMPSLTSESLSFFIWKGGISIILHRYFVMNNQVQKLFQVIGYRMLVILVCLSSLTNKYPSGIDRNV